MAIRCACCVGLYRLVGWRIIVRAIGVGQVRHGAFARATVAYRRPLVCTWMDLPTGTVLHVDIRPAWVACFMGSSPSLSSAPIDRVEIQDSARPGH